LKVWILNCSIKMQINCSNCTPVMEAIGCSNFSLLKSASLKFHCSLLLLPISSKLRFPLRLSSSMAIHSGTSINFPWSAINPAKMEVGVASFWNLSWGWTNVQFFCELQRVEVQYKRRRKHMMGCCWMLEAPFCSYKSPSRRLMLKLAENMVLPLVFIQS